MESSGFYKNALFVIVLYKKKLSDCQAYHSLATINSPSSPAILVYDNSPDASVIDNPNILYFHDSENRGVSSAYNYAGVIAQRLNKQWMLFLDQDTYLPSTTLNAYPIAISVFSREAIFTPVIKDGSRIVSPYKMSEGKGRAISYISEGIHAFGKYYIINSGMMISVQAFNAAGGYDEKFPLDFSDVVFCERLRKKYAGFVVIHGEAQHQLAANDPSKTFNQSLTRFQIFCNAITLYKKFYAPSLAIFKPVMARGWRLFFQHKKIVFLKLIWQTLK